MQKYLIIIGMIVLWGCTRDIELEQPYYQKKIVVDGWIESGGFANVFLTLSSPFLTEYDSVSIRNTFLNYAKITVSCSDGQSEVLTLFRESKLFPPFVYRSVSLKGETCKSYSLKVEVFGKTITATTTIPQPPKTSRIWMDSQSDSSGFLKVDLQPDSQKITRIFVQVKSAVADQNFHPCFTPVITLSPSNKEQNINVWRSRETNLYLMDPKQDKYDNWPKFQYALSDFIQIKIGTIDEESFEILRSIFNDQKNTDNPFALSGISIKTNIQGGIGRWTGIGVAPILLQFPSK